MVEVSSSWVGYEEGEVWTWADVVGEGIGVNEEGLLIWKLGGSIGVGTMISIVRGKSGGLGVDVCTYESTFSAIRLMRCHVFALSGHIFGEGGGCDGVGLCDG